LFAQIKKKVGKKVAAPPLVVKKSEPRKLTNPLFERRPKNFGIGKSST
jgi:large subunit ribosomal protein L7Ae